MLLSFTFIVRLLTTSDGDFPEIASNLRKEWSKWDIISRILVRVGADARTSGMFYKLFM